MSTATLRPGDVPVTSRQYKESQASANFGAVGRSSSLRNSTLLSNEQTHGHSASIPGQSSQYLIVSPYLEHEHQLDLSTLDTPNRLLARSLTKLESSSPNYATTEYSKTFNWSEVFATLRSLATAEEFHFPQTEFYVVEFRSKLREIIDNNLLFTLDKQSHREATAAGGLLKYWYGSPDSQRRNLATCLWRSKEDAIQGGKGAWHKQAREIISTAYESINVSGLRLTVEEGAEGWKFEAWSF